LFCIDEGQGLFEHTATINAIVYIIEGSIDFIVSGVNNNLTKESILEIPANTPYNFKAIDKTKMILIAY
jgi:quercetin dioxygenase-like cupin family protein